MENTLLVKELAEIENNDFVPKNKFTYKKAILKKRKIKKQDTIPIKDKSTFELFNSRNYTQEIIDELKKRPFNEIVAYFQSIPVLKDKLFYWDPFKNISDPLTLLMNVFDEESLLEKVKKTKCRSLIFHTKGFSNFEEMLQERINLGDLKVLDLDFHFFKKYWTTKKGKLSNLNSFLNENKIKVKHTRKTIDVYQRVITHPYWCENICTSSFHFLKLPILKNIEFSFVDCFSFFEIEIKQKTFLVSFAQFKGLIEKISEFEIFWNRLGVLYTEQIEFV